MISKLFKTGTEIKSEVNLPRGCRDKYKYVWGIISTKTYLWYFSRGGTWPSVLTGFCLLWDFFWFFADLGLAPLLLGKVKRSLRWSGLVILLYTIPAKMIKKKIKLHFFSKQQQKWHVIKNTHILILVYHMTLYTPDITLSNKVLK